LGPWFLFLHFDIIQRIYFCCRFLIRRPLPLRRLLPLPIRSYLGWLPSEFKQATCYQAFFLVARAVSTEQKTTLIEALYLFFA